MSSGVGARGRSLKEEKGGADGEIGRIRRDVSFSERERAREREIEGERLREREIEKERESENEIEIEGERERERAIGLLHRDASRRKSARPTTFSSELQSSSSLLFSILELSETTIYEP